MIIEARDLAAKDEAGTSDPYVKITVGNLPSQVTTAKDKTTTAVFNQNFTFTPLKMSDVDFENYEAKLEVFDQNQFYQNELIGSHSIGLATLYRNPQHEIYNQWLPLKHSKDVKKVQGYLLVSAYIIGESDTAPVHDANENNVEDEPDSFGGVPDDQLTGEQLAIRREKSRQIAMVLAPTPYQKQAQLMVNIVKAEDLPIFNKTIDSFISVRVNSITQVTSVIKSQQKPQFRVRMLFPITFPLNNDKIVIRVWDKRVCMSDTFIGQIPEVPTENDFFNIFYLQSKGGVLPYCWYSLYGIPPNERPSGYEQSILGMKKTQLGTAYMGRVLLSLNLTTSEKPETGVQPIGIYREPPIERYTLRLDTYEITQSKERGEAVSVRIRCGLKYIDSELANYKSDGNYKWPSKQISTSEDFEVPRSMVQQTDLIIELLNKERVRVAYIRMSTQDVELSLDRPKWYEFKDLKAQSNGVEATHSHALMNILFDESSKIKAMPLIILKRSADTEFMARFYMYAGYDICPWLYSKDLNVEFKIKFSDLEITSQQPISSKNPIWNQEIEALVKIQSNLQFVSDIVIKFTSKDTKIGEVNIPATDCVFASDKVEEKPTPKYKFYHLINNGKSTGRLLFGATLHKLQKNLKVSSVTKYNKIITEYIAVKLLFSIYAVRQLPHKLKEATIVASISIPVGEAALVNEKKIQSKLKGGDEETIYSPGFTDPNFLSVETLECYLPNPPQPLFTPQVEVELRSKDGKSTQYYCSISLIPYLMMETNVKQAYYNYFYSAIERPSQDYFELKTPETEETKQSIKQSYSIKNSKKSKQTMVQDQQQDDLKKSLHQDQEEPEAIEEFIEPQKQAKPKDSDEIYQLMQRKGIENAYVADQLDIDISEIDIANITKTRKDMSRELVKLLDKRPKPKNYEVLKAYIKDRVTEILYKPVLPDDFLSVRVGDLADDGIDYGRPIIRGKYEDEIQKNLPYSKFSIFELHKNASGLGNPTTGILKADISFASSEIRLSKVTSGTKKSDKIAYFKQLKAKDFPFDLFDPELYKYLQQQQFHCKVRIYIYRCLSLAAQGQQIDTYHAMAGQIAKNSANPYLEINIGEPDADPGDFVKKVSEVDRFMENTLSPNFFRSFELDALLPFDCFMNLKVMHKGMLSSLIGAVKIDLEDRLLGEKKLKSRISYQAYKSFCEDELQRVSQQENADDYKMELAAEIADLTQKIESFSSELIIPVEYQQLRHPDKLVSQGSVEMFIEVLPVEISRLIPPAQMIERPPQDYEIRVVIYETFAIPKTTKKVVDIFVRMTLDSSATGTGSEVSKETDTHMGSENGDGEFNWRMKFNFRTPCQFPRMKLSVLDFSVFGESPTVGEATISLKRVMSVMRTQSSYDLPPSQVKLLSAKFPGEERGTVLMQMSILQKSMAEAKPVGEAQEEPNIDPFLKKPTEGRGLGAFFKGIGFPWGMIIKQACMILLPMIISALVSFILFVKPGILMPQSSTASTSTSSTNTTAGG